MFSKINTDEKLDNAYTTTVQIHEEQLDISKRQVQLSEVNVRKEAITEEKTITVPVSRIELVIEKKDLTHSSSSEADNVTEVLRVPISEEHIDINKHMVQLEEVSINNHKFEEIEHINEILKKEKLKVKVTGNVKVENNAT